VEAPQDMDLQQTLIKIGQNDNVDPETAAQLIQKGNVKFIYRDYAQDAADTPKDYVEAEVNAGVLNGSGYASDESGIGEKTEFRFRLSDLRKLDVAKIKAWSENPMALLGDINGAVSELNRTLESVEILAKKMDKSGATVFSMGFSLNSGKIEAMFDGKVDDYTPKLRLAVSFDNLADINWQTAVLSAMNPDKMAAANVFLIEFAKLKNVSLQAEFTQMNVPMQAAATIVLGRFDIVANVFYPSGKPRGVLNAHIDNIKNIDAKQINPQDMEGLARILGVTGQYSEYAEIGEITYQKNYTPDNFMEVMAKMTVLVPTEN
jgi:hypothetical protein